MTNSISTASIPFKKGRVTLDVFQDTTPLILKGLTQQWCYDGDRSNLHEWNTSFGFEPDADEDYSGNKHRKALSNWLMSKQKVPPDTLVLLECVGFCGDDDQE